MKKKTSPWLSHKRPPGTRPSSVRTLCSEQMDQKEAAQCQDNLPNIRAAVHTSLCMTCSFCVDNMGSGYRFRIRVRLEYGHRLLGSA